MIPVTLYPLMGPDGNAFYMCPCGRQYPTMTESILCALSHGEGEERDE